MQEELGVGAVDEQLAKRALVEQGDAVARRAVLGGDGVEPGGLAEAQFRRFIAAFGAKKVGTLPTTALAEPGPLRRQTFMHRR